MVVWGLSHARVGHRQALNSKTPGRKAGGFLFWRAEGDRGYPTASVRFARLFDAVIVRVEGRGLNPCASSCVFLDAPDRGGSIDRGNRRCGRSGSDSMRFARIGSTFHSSTERPTSSLTDDPVFPEESCAVPWSPTDQLFLLTWLAQPRVPANASRPVPTSHRRALCRNRPKSVVTRQLEVALSRSKARAAPGPPRAPRLPNSARRARALGRRGTVEPRA